jgi:long-chain acyl-CoA synthetase
MSSRHFAHAPDGKTALIFSNGGQLTYGALDRAANQAAQLMRALGLRRGDVVAVLMENNPQFPVFCSAATRAGLYFCCISTQLAPAEVAYILQDSGAKLLLTSGRNAALAADVAAQVPGLAQRFITDGACTGFQSWELALAMQPHTPIADESEGQDLLYSSGTTGLPKGVKAALAAPGAESTMARLTALNVAHYGLGADTVYLSPGPLYHAAPLRWLLVTLRLGATAVVMDGFEAEQALQLIAQHRVTHSQWVPTMFVRLLRLPEAVRRAHDLSSMRCAVHAAAPCAVDVKRAMIAWWGPILWEYYAGTESNGATVISSAEWLAHPGSVGRAAMGRVHVLSEAGEELPARSIGAIYFSGGPAFEYLNDPGKTQSVHDTRGRSTIGDIGWLDEEGYLYLTDRQSNMIISGGVNIYPQEAENVLIAHPSVQDVAVIGVPNAEFGEEVKALVQLSDPSQASPELGQTLMAWCRERIAALKCPRSLSFVPELPRHANGKLVKRQLPAEWRAAPGEIRASARADASAARH